MSKGRKIARTYLPPELRDLLEKIIEKIGLSEAEVLRFALIEYAEKRSITRNVVPSVCRVSDVTLCPLIMR